MYFVIELNVGKETKSKHEQIGLHQRAGVNTPPDLYQCTAIGLTYEDLTDLTYPEALYDPSGSVHPCNSKKKTEFIASRT